MVTELNPPWWARWLPSAALKLVISGTGVEIHTREGIQSIDWTAISQHPKKSPIWFLHMAYITTPLGSWRLYFRKQSQQDVAWKELVRA